MLQWLIHPLVLQLSSSLLLSTLLMINSLTSHVILPTLTASSLGVFSASLIVMTPLICCALFMIFSGPQHPTIWPAIPSLLCFIGALVLHQLTATINLSFIITSGTIIALQIASMIHHYNSVANNTIPRRQKTIPELPDTSKRYTDTMPFAKRHKLITKPPMDANQYRNTANQFSVIKPSTLNEANKLDDMTYFIHLFHPKNAELAHTGWYRPTDDNAYAFYFSDAELQSYLQQNSENGNQPEFHESTYLADLVYIKIGQKTLPESVVNTHHLKWNRKHQCWSNQDIRIKLFDSFSYSIVERGLLSPIKEADHVTYSLTHNLDEMHCIDKNMKRKPVLTKSFNTLRTFVTPQNITIKDHLGNFISYDAFFDHVILFNLESMLSLRKQLVEHLNTQFSDLLKPNNGSCESALKYSTSKGWHIPSNDDLFDELLNMLDEGEATYFDPNRQYVFLRQQPTNSGEHLGVSKRYQNNPLIAIDAHNVQRYQDVHPNFQTSTFTA